MSEINGKYKQIMEELENHITDPKELEFVKEKFSDLSMLFIDMLDRVTKLTDNRIQQIEEKQQEISNRIRSVQTIVDGIENDIYEDEDEEENYEFEIVCPYCNYEFTADLEDEDRDEIKCPECHNTIELDWNCDEETAGCSGSCSHCNIQCVAEDDDDAKYSTDMEEEKENDNEDGNDEDSEDM